MNCMDVEVNLIKYHDIGLQAIKEPVRFADHD